MIKPVWSPVISVVASADDDDDGCSLSHLPDVFQP